MRWSWCVWLVALLVLIGTPCTLHAQSSPKRKKARSHATIKPRDRARRAAKHLAKVAKQAPIAFYMCRDTAGHARFGITGATPESAQRRCERENATIAREVHVKPEPCRCLGRDALVVRGPYRNRPRRRKPYDWYARNEFPYVGSDGQDYNRNGEFPTP